MSWQGRPLVSYETVVNLISHTKTRSGLKVKALLDTKRYQTGERFAEHAMEALRLKRHAFHGDWNYTLEPERHLVTTRPVRAG